MKARSDAYHHDYRRRPDVRAKSTTEEARAYQRRWDKTPKARAYVREYNQRPHVRALRQLHNRRWWARYLSAPGSHTAAEWRKLCALAGGHCLGCGASLPLEVDHVQPLTRGGCNCAPNLQPLCRSCNASKNNRRMIDYRTPEMLAWVQGLGHKH